MSGCGQDKAPDSNPAVQPVSVVASKLTHTLTIANKDATAPSLANVDNLTEIQVCFKDTYEPLTVGKDYGMTFGTLVFTAGNKCISIDSASPWSTTFPIGSIISVDITGLLSPFVASATFTAPKSPLAKSVKAFAPITPNSILATPVASQSLSVADYFIVSVVAK